MGTWWLQAREWNLTPRARVQPLPNSHRRVILGTTGYSFNALKLPGPTEKGPGSASVGRKTIAILKLQLASIA